MRINFSLLLALLLAPLLPLPFAATAQAGRVTVAFPNGLALAMSPLRDAFQSKTGNGMTPLAAATGLIYAKITLGTPFDVFLADDSETPKRAIAAGFAVEGTEFTYALGKIVLFSADPKLVNGAETLKASAFHKLAVADPKIGPYGTAPLEVMKKLGVYEALAPKLVVGKSLAEAYQSVDYRQVELGFVALNQVVDRKDGSQWLVPQEDYAPIPMDAVLLTPGKDNEAAKAFMDFLKSDEAVKIIHSYGFGTMS